MPKENTVLRGIEQGRAIFACEQVEDAKARFAHSKDESKYKAYVRRIPMLIKTNGMGATFAFIKAKGEPPYQLIYEQVGQWLNSYDRQTLGGNQDLVKVPISLPSTEYRAVTVEVLALFSWLRRFAEGLLEGDEVVGD